MNGTFATLPPHFDQIFIIMFILDGTCKLSRLIKASAHLFLSYVDYFISNKWVGGLCTSS